MKNNTMVTILISCIATFLLLYCMGYINENRNDEINDLYNKISNLEEDKLFYKNHYIEIAEDYNNKLYQLGINEYILTDTSR